MKRVLYFIVRCLVWCLAIIACFYSCTGALLSHDGYYSDSCKAMLVALVSFIIGFVLHYVTKRV